MEMLRQYDKDKVSAMLDAMTERVTFAQAKRLFRLPQAELSELMKDLVFFKLVNHEGLFYQTDLENRRIWDRYDRECDYMVFYNSDTAKRTHELNGVNSDVIDYEHADLTKIDYMECDDNECD